MEADPAISATPTALATPPFPFPLADPAWENIRCAVCGSVMRLRKDREKARIPDVPGF